MMLIGRDRQNRQLCRPRTKGSTGNKTDRLLLVPLLLPTFLQSSGVAFVEEKDHLMASSCNLVAIAAGWFARLGIDCVPVSLLTRIAYFSDRELKLMDLERHIGDPTVRGGARGVDISIG